MENCNSLYLCSVLMPRNINGGEAYAWKLTWRSQRSNRRTHPPKNTGKSLLVPVRNHKQIKKKKSKTKSKQRSHRKLCTTNRVVNKTSTCVFVTKRPSNSLFLILFCTTWFITTVQIHQVVFFLPNERENRLWQPVSCILSLEWSHPPPAPDIRARRPEVLRVPYSQRMHIAYKFKKRQAP